MKPYRHGVVAVFVPPSEASGSPTTNPQVLVCRRKKSTEWQLPQGGLKKNKSAAPETEEDAVYREVLEELGNNHFRILRKARNHVRYDFPFEMKGKLALKYQGQEHRWFLCEYLDGNRPQLELATYNDFDQVVCVSPQEALERIVSWKRHVYKRGLKELGLL